MRKLKSIFFLIVTAFAISTLVTSCGGDDDSSGSNYADTGRSQAADPVTTRATDDAENQRLRTRIDQLNQQLIAQQTGPGVQTGPIPAQNTQL